MCKARRLYVAQHVNNLQTRSATRDLEKAKLYPRCKATNGIDILPYPVHFLRAALWTQRVVTIRSAVYGQSICCVR